MENATIIDNNFYLDYLNNQSNEFSNGTLVYSYDQQETTSKSGHRSILWYLQLYFTPAIIAIGFMGNGLSFIVFVKTRLRHLSSSVYLAALCVADTLFLVQLFAWWLIYVRIFIYHKEGFCQAFIYISYVSSFLSVWFVVGFTVERYIVCIYPLRKQSVCRVSRARIIVVVITLVAAVMYNFGAWTSGTVPYFKGRWCIPLDRFRSIISVLNNVDTFVTLIVPSVLIVFMNLRIVLKLSKFSLVRSKLLGHHEEESSNILSRAPSISSHNALTTGKMHLNQRSMIQKSQMKITKMLVSVSSIFVVLNLPSHVIRVYITLVDLFTDYNYDPPKNIALTQQAFNYIYYTNFAVNFFLYSLCGQNFRMALRDLFTKWKHKVTTSSTFLIRSSAMLHNPVVEMSSATGNTDQQSSPKHPKVTSTKYSSNKNLNDTRT